MLSEAIHMTRYRALALITKYWMPKTDYLSAIAEAAKKVKDGDFLVVSEKAISAPCSKASRRTRSAAAC